ncbi:uncharacterized protein M437DRAFT_69369 [Aureobasidium melanogenum CBS 110374]|uniref:Uncharacterized protein n=1 Tax=Aureobasidium melanogenum (strain CBS 110374) TaxID=1043003 RepID=A0A074VMV0_AURM1|nr:uncharacterized protein M437DRAFT_69369 [Aureobasidium melanogenum CBS 110374]KEQ59007.1 hypothetical protein M437DRAFT_69369 [Aureobasidium melanogenum CBS 110374]
MKDLFLIFILTLLGSMGVLAAPVEQYTKQNPKSLFSSWMSNLHVDQTHSRHHNSSRSTSHGSHQVSVSTHKADKNDIRTKTETQIITEDCSATDDGVRTTVVEMVPTTRVLVVTPSYIKTKTVIETVLYDVTKPASSTRSHRPTKHTLTETVISSSPTTSRSSKKHTRSKSSKTHTRSSKTTESAVPSHSVSSFYSSKKEVVVTTSEVVEVVTVGYTEVSTTMTLTEGDSRLSSTTPAASTKVTGSLHWPPYLTDLSKYAHNTPEPQPTDAVVGDLNNTSSFSTSIRTIHHNKTSKSLTMPDRNWLITLPAALPAASQGANDIVENLSARDDDDDDPDHDYKKYRKPDKAMSKRMSRWSKHHSKSMEKQSDYKQEAQAKSRSLSAKSADKAHSKSIENAKKASKKHHDGDDDQVASVGLDAREVSMAAPATTYVEVTVTTTVLPTQNGTYSISYRTVHASRTGSADRISTSKASKTHSKASSKAHESWRTVCAGLDCLRVPALPKTTHEAEDATMSSTIAEQYPTEEPMWHCMIPNCHSRLRSADVASTVKPWTPKVSPILTDSNVCQKDIVQVAMKLHSTTTKQNLAIFGLVVGAYV